MAEPISTPSLPPPIFKSLQKPATKEQIFSSSPGFGTPAYPIASRPVQPLRQPFTLQQNNSTTSGSTVLPILLPPQTLRPVAFRTLTKKHNLTLTSSGLGLLATFVGKFCGHGWREEGLAERILDEVAKSWRRQGGGVLIEDGVEKKLSAILKSLEPCMSGGRIDTAKLSRANSSIGGSSLSRQTSFMSRPDANREDSQTSLGVSGLDIEDDELIDIELEEQRQVQDARSFLKVVSAFTQPQFIYSTTKKALEPVSRAPTLLPPIQHKIALFRNRYHLIHQRLLRNEAFQAPAFSTSTKMPGLSRSASAVATIQQAYKITLISNLLGRSGGSHLLLGMLANSAAGDLTIADLSGSIVLDTSRARTVPEDGAWFCPGMIVLVEGLYEEDGSNNSNLASAGGVGGQIKGQFLVDTFASPPTERRETTLGVGQQSKSDNAQTSIGAGFGWIDFLGVGSEKAIGSQMRRLQRSVIGRPNTTTEEPKRSKTVIVGECHLDNPRILEGIRAILSSYTTQGSVETWPLTIVLMGNFVSSPALAGSTKGIGSVEYKEYFDSLASMLSEFPNLLSSTTFVFVPGDNDPWASSFSAGAASILPKQGIPDLFTSRIRRAITNANNDARKKEGDVAGEAIWTSNPSRMTLFGPTEEIVLFRDDITGRLRRNAVVFSKPQADDEDEGDENDQATPSHPDNNETNVMELDPEIEEAASHIPTTDAPTTTTMNKTNTSSRTTTNTMTSTSTDTATARKLVKTILDQTHLSPFPITIRPVLWDYASSLSLYPLPTALVLADAEAPAFAITYEGCHVMNPGRVLDELGARKGIARFVEYDVRNRRGVVKEVRF